MGMGTGHAGGTRTLLPPGSGRAPPAVRRDRSIHLWERMAPGLLAGWPFLVVGTFGLVVGGLLLAHVVRLLPNSGLPLWVLFLGIGIIAFAGAALGALAPEETPTPTQRPARLRPTAARPLRPAQPARPVPAPLPVTEVPENLHEPWEEEEGSSEDPEAAGTAALFSLPYPGPPPATSAAVGSEGFDASGEDTDHGEVLAQLEQLTTLMRPTRSAAPAGGPGGYVRYCIGCERSISGEEEPVFCTTCRGALCPDCGRASQSTEAAGRCPTCAALAEAEPNRSDAVDPF
ncbi:MAG TPA: hypothetical protein VGU43_04425 [Thermoplasmata archaeon]|nr:hypothetical protein [Thermoplasmata archaeon]